MSDTLPWCMPVGVRLEDDDRLDLAAPFGLDDVFAIVVRPNRALDNAVAHPRCKSTARAGNLA